MQFSQRIGKKPIKSILQVESIDADLRNRLWNTILDAYLLRLGNTYNSSHNSYRGNACKTIWKNFFLPPVDKISTYSGTKIVFADGVIQYIRDWYFEAEWYEVYDLIEFIVSMENGRLTYSFIEECNAVLKKEVAGYRVVNERVVQITSEEEVQEIEVALNASEQWRPVNIHLRAALDLLADRANPDYRNSIKESISAVESFCKILTNEPNTTLGKALNEIEKQHALHKALKNAFSSLYGYTSDADGIRHALLEGETAVGFEDAKFMLVSCSAFINYLKAKTGK